MINIETYTDTSTGVAVDNTMGTETVPKLETWKVLEVGGLIPADATVDVYIQDKRFIRFKGGASWDINKRILLNWELGGGNKIDIKHTTGSAQTSWLILVIDKLQR